MSIFILLKIMVSFIINKNMIIQREKKACLAYFEFKKSFFESYFSYPLSKNQF